jgi:O-antigen ligase
VTESDEMNLRHWNHSWARQPAFYPPRGQFGVVAPTVARSKWSAEATIDLLFASASVASISGFDLPGLHIPVLVAFVAVIGLVSARRLVRAASLSVFVPPFVAFMCVHLAFAFRVSAANGLLFVEQAFVAVLFVWAFAARYSQVSMRRYLRFTGIGMAGLLIVVLYYHFSRGVFTALKLLNDPKAVFDVLPVMLLVLRFSETRLGRSLYVVLLPIFITAILLSGERKAYILLALIAPFLINLKATATYVGLLVLLLAVPVGISLDRHGYIDRQLSTLASFAEGKTESTISDDKRGWAVAYALKLFEENPLIGVGTNGYHEAAMSDYREVAGTHNEWMRVAAENGLLGLFFYTTTVFWGFVGLFRRRVGSRDRSAREIVISFALFTTFVMYLSFEALDLIVVIAFCMTPIVQYLRLDPRRDADDAASALSGPVQWP